MTKCQISGKSSMNGNRVSHSNMKTKHKLKANIQRKRIFDVELSKWIRLKISTRVLRTLSKKSFSAINKKY